MQYSPMTPASAVLSQLAESNYDDRLLTLTNISSSEISPFDCFSGYQSSSADDDNDNVEVGDSRGDEGGYDTT
jgi:hypothetical protein